MLVPRIATTTAFARVPILASAALIALYGVASLTPAYARKAPPPIASWHYQLQNINLTALSQTDTDLLVIDYAETPADGPMVPFTKSEIERLKTKPDGGRRIVLSYLSIGEAERYRFYWKAEYAKARPAWLVGPSKGWPGNYRVRYWIDEWTDIIVRGQGSYLDRILDAGFDGVYLDGLGKYAGLTAERPDARQAMMTLVKEIADTARKHNPDFIVVAQNADELLQDAEYRATIDAIGKEDYLYGDNGDGSRNSDENIRSSRENLKLIQSAGKMVLVAEYFTNPVKQSVARAEIERDGFIPIFVRRELDAAPLQPSEPASVAIAIAERDNMMALGAAVLAKASREAAADADTRNTCQDRILSASKSDALQFAPAQASITVAAKVTLDRIAAAIKTCPMVQVRIEGHTDSDNARGNNLKLSAKRAEAVAQYLVRAGIAASRIQAVGLGDVKPIAPNDTPENKARNRRIEFVVAAL